MNVYIEKFTAKDGYKVIKRGNIVDVLPLYNEFKINNPVQLCIDHSNCADIPDYTNPVIQFIHKQLGIKVIGHLGQLHITEAFENNERGLFKD